LPHAPLARHRSRRATRDARGVDILLGAHNYLDLTPKGRNETSTMDWVRLHDRYGV